MIAPAARDLAPPTVGAARSTRELLAAGAIAGLLPFAHRTAAPGSTVPGYGAAMAAIAASAGASPARTVERVPAPNAGDGHPPELPTGPPGNAGAGGIAGAGGGVTTGVWCVLLLCCLLYLAQELRRHRIRLSLPAPTGVVLLLHRPG